ncbi:hypothetical protein L8R80_11130 [Vibrio splendidus]|jgi:hypothetical protein|uniref:Rap1a immunity protein domain-containing protein n=1 Tax=Vibrio splendidus TaxID=29497 RepID=A0A2N7CKT1_VIBSP|nr:hypothetical protein [Vibrio splendidus]MDH5911739.1 hypothetical protein [Vibrio splendidus]MDH5941829.1 hypothetical protein [Vibrio splendidus]MDH5985977.1 hypothetical protein [Vibrio splendidus]MDH5993793.1 hypothetical protein [Vibrio splendidus]MDH6004681.1 hypothetical protein [Vibrio splendidus]
MKVSKVILIVGMFFLFTNQVNALSVSNYKKLKKDDFSILKTHVNGVGQGIGWGNTLVENRLKQKLYCSPQKIALNAGNFITIIDTEIESGNWENTDPIELILIIGLEKTFPCE